MNRNTTNFGESILNALTDVLNTIISFIPQFLAGLIILLIGILIATFLRELIQRGLGAINIDKWFGKAGVKDNRTQGIWTNVIAQLVFWSVIILFLIPAADSWGLPQVTRLINQFLMYLPNVFAALIIAFAGMVAANMLFGIVRNSIRNFGTRGAVIVATIIRWSIIIFTGFIVLNQLGVASNLIQILFTGVVATFVIGFGLAIGFGAQDAVRELLDQGVHSKAVQDKIQKVTKGRR